MVSSREVEERLRARGLEPRWTGAPPEAFRGFTDDSREVREGDLFCAVRGLAVDGHRFLGEAREAGATAAVVERAVADAGLPQAEVSDTRSAAAHLASLFHGDPSRAVRVVGITGTNGKTTTAWLLRHLLGAAGPAASLGTLGVVGPDGSREAGALTTPGPVELSATLAGLRERGVARVAMEVSSHALDQRRADGVELAGLVLTNLSREHLDYHEDMEAYRDAKLRALELLRADGVCVLDAGEPAWEGAVPADGPETLTFGLVDRADVRAEDVRETGGGSRWRLVTPAGDAEVRLPLPGDFNVRNALAAAAAALVEGVGVGEAARRLSGAPQVPGRMEVLRRRPSMVVRDYAHTPEALARVLRQLRPEGGDRLLVVFGCGGDRDAGKRPLMGRAAAEGADLAIVTTDNPRSEDPASIASQVVEGMGRGDYELEPDRRRAIARALELAGPGDVVLLAGKGHEDYQIFGDRKEPFDEARIVAELTPGDGEAASGRPDEGGRATGPGAADDAGGAA